MGAHESGMHGMDGKFWRTLPAGTAREKEFKEEEEGAEGKKLYDGMQC